MELNNDCNLKCEMCRQNFNAFDGECMSKENEGKIFNEMDGKLTATKPNYLGEPLMYPNRLLSWIGKCKEASACDVRLNTNGLLLTEHLFIQLMHTGLDLIIFSIDKYHNNRRVLDKLKIYQRIKKDCSSRTPIIRVNYIKGAKFKDDGYKIADELHEAELLAYHDWETKDTTPLPKWRCSQLWQRLLIKVNGDIQPCCGESHPSKVLGNIKDKTIKEIWHSPALTIYRRLHAQGKSHSIQMCQHCALRKFEVSKL